MSRVSDRRKRQVALAILGTILLTSVVGATLVVGAERTVMNPSFVTDELGESGLYESMAADLAEQFQPGNDTDVSLSLAGDGPDPPIDRLATEAVTPTYVRGQVERNVEIAYAYFDGERETLPLAFDLEPVTARFATGMEDWVGNLSPGALSPRMGRLAANESSFRATRTSFREAQLNRIQNMTREEKTREELLAIYDDNRDRIRDELNDRLVSRVDEQGIQDPVREEAIDYGSVGVETLVAQNASYDAYLDQERAARQELAAAVGTLTTQRLDEQVPDSAPLLNQSNGTPPAFETMRAGFSLAGILLFVLPVVALLVAGAIGYLSRRRSTGLLRVGGVVALGGGLTLVGALLLSRVLPGVLNADPTSPSAVPDAMLGVVAAVVDVLTIQAGAVLAVGLVLTGVGLGIRRGLVPIDDAATPTGESGSSGQASEGESTES